MPLDNPARIAQRKKANEAYAKTEKMIAKKRRDYARRKGMTIAEVEHLVEPGEIDPETVVNAITNGDLSQLDHSGLVSVQMQPPGQAPAPANGSSKACRRSSGRRAGW